MAQSEDAKTVFGDEDNYEEFRRECEQLQQTLPTQDWVGGRLQLYQGFWNLDWGLPKVINFQRHFQAHDTDIFLVTKPKCGTTWLKALVFAIVNRRKYTYSVNPLLKFNPHELVPFIGFNVGVLESDLANIPSPRIFGAHIPFHAMPESIKNSKCPIIYIGRNPFDAFVSSWHYWLAEAPAGTEFPSIETVFDQFCNAIELTGPFWDHVLGYWKESKERPNKVLFLKYEDLTEDINLYVKRIAEFIGFPFSKDEEREGKIEEISRLCSFEHLRNLEVNTSGTLPMINLGKKNFFRKAQVGDWVNHLSPSMVEHLEKITQDKLDGSGLTFRRAL